MASYEQYVNLTKSEIKIIKKDEKRYKAKMYQRVRRRNYNTLVSSLERERDELEIELAMIKMEVAELWKAEIILLKRL